MSIRNEIASAAKSVDTAPTDAQSEAGNYAKGHVQLHGMHIVIENPKGSTRSGVDVHGKPWSTTMAHHYGYVRSSEGADGDPVDVFLGPKPDSGHVFVIDQRNPATGAFDEHKCMVGFETELEAKDAYHANYQPGWQGFAAVTHMDIEGFRAWLESGETLTAAGLPPDKVVDMDPDALIGTFRGKVIQFRVVGWDTDAGRPIAKADGSQAIPPGAHWITCHPNGPGTKGNAVLVVPVEGHKGVHRVIGGAGGKLNGLRMQGVKDHGTYEAEAKERRQQQAAKEGERKAALTPEQRVEEKEQKATAKGARREAEEAFIQKVLGNTGEAQPLFEEGNAPNTPSLSHGERLAKAKAVAAVATKRIMLDAETRLKAGVGKIGGGQASLDMDDVLQEHMATGPGYRRALAERAAKAGLTAEKLAEKVAEIRGNPVDPREDSGRPTPVPTEDEAKDNQDLHKEAKVFEAGKAAAMRDAVKQALEDHGDLAQILKARAIMREAIAATKKDKSPTYEPGYQMVTTEDTTPDESAINDIHQQMLTQHVVQFLQEVGDHYPPDEVPDPFGVPPEGGLASARGAGAFDALHETALASIGQGVIERDTVEALGPEHSAMIVARAIRHEFTPEDQADILEALESHHLDEQAKLPEVVDEAQRLKSAADAMGTELAATPRDFNLALEMQKQKISVLKEARQLLGANLGRIEARAALIAALRQPPQAELTIPMGRMTAEKAVQTAAALGLQDGDYQINHDSGEAVLHLHEAGQDRLIQPVDQPALAERQTAMALKGGQMDEDNWIPKGFADRKSTRYDNPLQEPAEFRRELAIAPDTTPENVAGSIKDYAGALMADGHDPASVVADLNSAMRKQALPENLREHYEKALREIAPLRATDTDEHGAPIQEVDKTTGHALTDTAGKPVYRTRMRRPAEIRADLEKCLHGYLGNGGEANLTLEGQTVDTDHDFHEAMHRALAEDPRAAAAFTPVGEMTGEQQGHMRDYFYKQFFDGAKNPEEAKKAKFRAAVEALGPEPPKENPDSLGTQMSLMDLLSDEDAGDAVGAAVNPHWVEWNNKHLELEQEHQEKADGPSPWASYVQKLGGLKFAQQAIQDEIKGQFNERFHGHYQKLTGKVLQMDTTEQASANAHLQATLGDEEAGVLATERRSKQAKLQKRGGGQFREGGVGDAMKDAGQAQALAAAEGGSLFGMDELDETPAATEGEAKAPWQKPERAQGERYSLGRSMEAQLRANMPGHAADFAGRRDAVKVREGMHMGGAYVNQQRCAKAIINLKRIGLFQGAGSGKTAIMQGALSELHATGKLKGKAILAVPSIVQGQFGAEAVQFIDPTSGFHVHAQPGESWEERLRAYQDPDKHAVVVTHQTLRDDTLRMLASHLDMGMNEAKEHLMGLPKQEAAKVVKAAMWAHGVDVQALMCDEAHGALDRDGKADSVLSRILDCHSNNAEYSVMATGDPMKNDVSEVWSDLNKIDPHKWGDDTKDEFMRRYGQNAALAKKSMAQELSRYWFNGRVKVPVEAHKRNENIPLTDKQNKRIAEVETAAAKLRIGEGDMVAHAKALAPKQFEGKPEEEHAAIAAKVAKGVGTFRESGMNRAINLDPEGGKLAHHVQVAKDRIAEGKPVVIFAHNLEAVAQIHAAMEKAGLKSTSLTGKDSSKDKTAKVADFDGGRADVIVMSDAGATGVNLQHGAVIIHHDTPMTAMTHNQRTARIHRLGQTRDVEVISAMADHPWERTAMDRIKRKDALGSIFQSPDGYLDDTGLAGSLREIRDRRAQATGAAA